MPSTTSSGAPTAEAGVAATSGEFGGDPDPPPKDVTYQLKNLKRPKEATKTKFLLGSDMFLYEWTEGNVPGKVVGQKTTPSGKYKFFNKPPEGVAMEVVRISTQNRVRATT